VREFGIIKGDILWMPYPGTYEPVSDSQLFPFKGLKKSWPLHIITKKGCFLPFKALRRGKIYRFIYWNILGCLLNRETKSQVVSLVII
jgi:hypothetical protein